MTRQLRACEENTGNTGEQGHMILSIPPSCSAQMSCRVNRVSQGVAQCPLKNRDPPCTAFPRIATSSQPETDSTGGQVYCAYIVGRFLYPTTSTSSILYIARVDTLDV